MKARFVIGAVAKRPSPVRERPIRKALLRAISGMYDDSRPRNHVGAEARLISQPLMPEPLLPDKSNACAAFAALLVRYLVGPRWSSPSRRAPSSNLPARLPSWPLFGVLRPVAFRARP